jgi:hypothetical protein
MLPLLLRLQVLHVLVLGGLVHSSHCMFDFKTLQQQTSIIYCSHGSGMGGSNASKRHVGLPQVWSWLKSAVISRKTPAALLDKKPMRTKYYSVMQGTEVALHGSAAATTGHLHAESRSCTRSPQSP